MDSVSTNNSNNNVSDKGYRAQGAITTPTKYDTETMCQIIYLYNGISAKQLKKHLDYDLPKGRGIAFKVLIHLHVKGNISTWQIKAYLGCSGVSLNLVLKWLVGVGYIREVGRPRLIIPFQRFKVDKAYKISGQGEAVLQRIFGEILD